MQSCLAVIPAYHVVFVTAGVVVHLLKKRILRFKTFYFLIFLQKPSFYLGTLIYSEAGKVFVLHHSQLARVGVGVGGPVSPLEVAVAVGSIAVADVPGDTAEGDPLKVDSADQKNTFKAHAIN